MISNYSYKLYSLVSELPSNWDNLATTVFLNKKYLTLLENASPKNCSHHYIGLFYEDELVGIALSQFIDLSEIASFGDRDHCIKTTIRNFVFKNFSSKLLFIGNNMLTGQNGFCFAAKLPYSDGLLLLNSACEELKKQYKKNGIAIHLTIFKDYNWNERTLFNLPVFNSYYQFSTQPNMVFTINPDWNSFDDYLGALQKKYRDHYKRARKKSEGITKKKMTLEEVKEQSAKIHELYLNVARNAPFNTFFLPENHFEEFKLKLDDSFLIYGYYLDNQLIGFTTLIKNGKIIETYFLGYDSEYQREYLLYLNMLYDMIGYSIKKGYQSIIFARTALEIKSSVGATPEKMVGFMKHSNPVINFFISKIFSYLEPEIKWTIRNPFK